MDALIQETPLGEQQGFRKFLVLRFACSEVQRSLRDVMLFYPFPWVKTLGYDYQSLRDPYHCRIATADDDLAFLAFFASAAGGWRLGVIKKGTLAKACPVVL